jgi:hypothetical protein
MSAHQSELSKVMLLSRKIWRRRHPTNGEQRKAYAFSLSGAYFRSSANYFSILKEFPNTF